MAEVQFAYSPLAIHKAFHATHAREKLLLGSIGSGKTIALCADAILHGLHQPGSRILVGRKEASKLKNTTEAEFLGLLTHRAEEDEGSTAPTLYDLCEVKRGAGHVDTLTLPNGSEYLFRGVEDHHGLMSLNLSGVYLDEASQVAPEAYDNLMSRLRQTEPTPEAQRLGYTWKGEPRHTMALASNSAGHNWIWDLFINPKSPKPEGGRVFFRSSLFDNPYLPDTFVQSMLDRPLLWQKRYVYSLDDAFAGQILVFDQRKHVVESFVPPLHWERACGLDWGMRSPTAVVWWARDPDTGVWHQYREWTTFDSRDPRQREEHTTATVHDVAKKILELEGDAKEKVRWRACDPALATRNASDGKSIQWWFAQYGLHFIGGLKRHEPRINALNSMLHDEKLVLMDSCPQTITGFSQYRWEDVKLNSDERDLPERPRKKDDHEVDAAQYIATLLIPEERKRVEAVKEHPDQTRMRRMREQAMKKRHARPAGFGYV